MGMPCGGGTVNGGDGNPGEVMAASYLRAFSVAGSTMDLL